MNQKRLRSLRRDMKAMGHDWKDVSYQPWKFFSLLLPVPHTRVKPILRTKSCGRSIYQRAKEHIQHGI